MTRPASTELEATAVSTSICDQETTPPPGVGHGEIGECRSDFEDRQCRPCLWPGQIEVMAQPQGQDRSKPTCKTEKMKTPTADVGMHDSKASYIQAKDKVKSQIERTSTLEMRAYLLSSVYAKSPCPREQSSTDGTFNSRSRSLDQPNLRRRRSWNGTQGPNHPPASACPPQSLNLGGSQHSAGETKAWAPQVILATVERWCEEFRDTKVSEWQNTVEGFSQSWKQWCFAQRRARVFQDNLIKEAIKHFWQPLGDFNYILSVYSFLEGVNNRNLSPRLRPVYMAWRAPEQTRYHEGCDLGGEEDRPFENDTPRENGSRAAASKYPLTRGQRLRLARICGGVDRMLKDLRHWLDMFQRCRKVCVMASTGGDLPTAILAEHRRGLSTAARHISSHSQTLISQLRDSRTSLCEALGLDPDKVPGGESASVPTMTATKHQKAVGTRSPCQGGLPLPRGFGLKKASLQASRIALKANLYITLLPCKSAQRILGRMMARSTDMATAAREAGDHKAEATMRRLHNKLRKIHERAGQEFPDVKPRMTLLDSETWPAVLNPREDMRVEIHGDISLPVETLIDMLHASRVSSQHSESNTQLNR